MAAEWNPSSPPLLSFAEASAAVATHAAELHPPIHERCDLNRALDRILAAPIVADRDQPPFNRTIRDGYAVRAQDVAEGRPFRIIGQVRAGEAWTSEPLQQGEAIEIMTGAPLPPGADAVLMVEHTRIATPLPGQPSVRWIVAQESTVLTGGENVVSRGSEARAGESLLPAGSRLGAEQIALAASCGHTSVMAYRKPCVAILPTGDELFEADFSSSAPSRERLAPHQIYDSNSFGLAALVQKAGAESLRLSPVRDERALLTAAIQSAGSHADLLLLTGGVSMGRYDLVEDILSELGAEFIFQGVRIQPGKPIVFGYLPESRNQRAQYFFGLPGNPVSALVTFRLFVEPILAALGGDKFWQPRMALACTSTTLQPRPGLTRFLPAQLDTTATIPSVTSLSTKGSGDQAGNARGNCYLIVPEDSAPLHAGDSVRVILR